MERRFKSPLQPRAVRRSGDVPAWWVEHEGHLRKVAGSASDALYFAYPLTGRFEFSVDGYHSAEMLSQLSYGGRELGVRSSPRSGNTLISGLGESQTMAARLLRPDAFHRLTLQVEPGKIRYLINGQLVLEESDPAPTSPWLTLAAQGAQPALFRNVSFKGTPAIARDVHLTHGDRLEGWSATKGEKTST